MMREKTMDCPILSTGTEDVAGCPDPGCPLYDGEQATCHLRATLDRARACLEDGGEDLPPERQRMLESLLHAARTAPLGGPREEPAAASELSFLLSEVDERRQVQELLLAALERIESSDGALRDEVRTLGDRLEAQASSLGTLEERFGAMARTVGTLQTDSLRLSERLAGDVSQQTQAMASRVEDGATATRRVMEDLSSRVEDLRVQGKSFLLRMDALAASQKEDHDTARVSRDSLTERVSELQRDAGKVDERIGRLGSRIEGGFSVTQKLHEDLLGKVLDLSSSSRGFVDRLQALETRLEDLSHGLEEPLQGASVALDAWRAEAREVLQSLQERAEEDRRGAQRAREEEARELNARGVLLFHEGSLEAARRAFQRSADLRPDYAEAHNNLGLVQSRLGMEEDAVVSFQKAMSCGEELPAALNNLGFLYHTQMRTTEAVEMFQKALQADPQMAPAFVNLGNAYYHQGHNALALGAWRKALEIDPTNEDAILALRSFDLEVEAAGS
jgi:tetratricopeptide (TPR) repeat protein